eukprot:Ihof_evm4s31 gene=Ihof_evmTU4s31
MANMQPTEGSIDPKIDPSEAEMEKKNPPATTTLPSSLTTDEPFKPSSSSMTEANTTPTKTRRRSLTSSSSRSDSSLSDHSKSHLSSLRSNVDIAPIATTPRILSSPCSSTSAVKSIPLSPNPCVRLPSLTTPAKKNLTINSRSPSQSSHSPTFSPLRYGSISSSPALSPKSPRPLSPLSPLFFATPRQEADSSRRLSHEYHKKFNLTLPEDPSAAQRRSSLEVPSGDLLRHIQQQRRSSLEVPMDRRLSIEKRPNDEDFKLERRMSIDEIVIAQNSPQRRASTASQNDLLECVRVLSVPVNRKNSLSLNSPISDGRDTATASLNDIRPSSGGAFKRSHSGQTLLEEEPPTKRPRTPLFMGIGQGN